VAVALVASVLILLNDENVAGEVTLTSARGPWTLPLFQQVDDNYREDGIVPQASGSQLYTTSTANFVQALPDLGSVTTASASQLRYDQDPDHADGGTDVTQISESDVQHLVDNINGSDEQIDEESLKMAKKVLTQRGGIHELKPRVDLQTEIDKRRERILNIPTVCADGEACDSLKKAQTDRFAVKHPTLEAALSSSDRAKELATTISTHLKKLKSEDLNKANMTLAKSQISDSINYQVTKVKDTARAIANAMDKQSQADQSRQYFDQQREKAKAEEEEKKQNEWKRQWQEAHGGHIDEEKKETRETKKMEKKKDEDNAEAKYWWKGQQDKQKQGARNETGTVRRPANGGYGEKPSEEKVQQKVNTDIKKALQKKERQIARKQAIKGGKKHNKQAKVAAQGKKKHGAKTKKLVHGQAGAANPEKPLASNGSGGQKTPKKKPKKHNGSAVLLQEAVAEAQRTGWATQAEAQLNTHPNADFLSAQNEVAQLAARAHAARASATSLKDTLRAQLREVRDARKQVREIVTHHTMPTKEEALKMAFTRVAKKRQLVATRLAKEHIAELHQVREEMEHMLKP